MFILWACLLDESYITNTVALAEGSIWTGTFTSTFIRKSSAKQPIVQKRLKELAYGKLAAYLTGATNPSEESDSDSQPMEHSSSRGLLHEAPAPARGTPTTTAQSLHITSVELTSELFAVDPASPTERDHEKDLLEYFTQNGAFMASI